METDNTQSSTPEDNGQPQDLVAPESVGNKKIAVIGDSYHQFLVLPNKTPENKRRNAKGLWVKAGAVWMTELIEAACTCKVKAVYIPDENENEQIVASGLLKEYKSEKNTSEILDKLGIEAKKKHRLRVSESHGKTILDMSRVFRNDKNPAHDSRNDSDSKENIKNITEEINNCVFWVINDDWSHFEDDEYRTKKKSRQEDILVSMKKCMERNTKDETSLTRPDWILWNPHNLGDNNRKENSGFKSFFLGDDQGNGSQSQTEEERIKEVKQRTIVFLRADDLADDGVGQRGDSSNEEFLEGIIDAIENDQDMQRLAGFAAIVIENGVDSAFLVQFVQDKKEKSKFRINHCQSFHRIWRTPHAYQQIKGYMTGIGAFMVASCLKMLCEANEVMSDDFSCHTCDKKETCEKGHALYTKAWSERKKCRVLGEFRDGEDAEKCNEYEEDTERRCKHHGNCQEDFSEIEKYRDCSKKLFYHLSEGIKDSLVRLLLHYHVGYLEGKKENDKSVSAATKIYNNPYEVTKCAPSTLTESEQKEKNHHDVTDIFVERFVNKTGLYPRSNGHENETNQATYVSRFLRFRSQTLDFLPPSLLEKQWGQLKEGFARIKRYKYADDCHKKEGQEHSGLEHQNDLLEAIVLFGLKRLKQHHVIRFPYLSFENFNALDPEEVSTFRRLHNLLRKYKENPNDTLPLGIAVFGSPGTGKSYGIKKLVDDVFGANLQLECNLSQFKDVAEFYRKLLEVRTLSSSGAIPMVLLDEFDVTIDETEFGWCKYLLSVFQDGKFRVDNVVHELGKVFFVCVGGLNESFREFELKSRVVDAVYAKLPDFIGRLRGHVNVKGPNPCFPFPKQDDEMKDIIEQQLAPSIHTRMGKHDIITWENVTDSTQQKFHKAREQLDPLYKIRRAMLLRNILKRKMPSIYHEETRRIKISRKVLRALLNLEWYKYGSRSIEAIVDMCVAVSPDSSSFTKAMLPPPGQLDMHIDSADFYALMKTITEADK